jgi:hypothetical protein
MAYRSQAQQAKHYGAIQATIAEAATNQVEHRQRLDTQLNTLHERQRNETITETAHLAERNDFADDYSDGLHSDSAAGSHADNRATAPGTSSAANDTEQRADLS